MFRCEFKGDTYCTPRGKAVVFVHSAIWARTWFAKEHDITKDGWPVAQLQGDISLAAQPRKNSHLPKVDKTALSEKDDVTSRRHREAVNLRLDIDDLLRILLQPRNINLDVKVTNATKESERSTKNARAIQHTCRQ
jgi:hypothetical protein